MTGPLNPLLYERLRRRFGEVRIQDEGVAMVARYIKPLLSKEPRLEVQHPGEYYRVECPFCNDNRFRLYINHRWGVRDETGNKNLFLAYCFNENCLADFERKLEFLEDLTELDGGFDQARIRQGTQPPTAATVATWPGPVTRIDRLPPHHPANAYLISRFFDPERLGRVYGVSYCEDSHFYMARRRIIIPIYQDRAFRGWTARFVGELDWKDKNNPRKYYNMPDIPRRSLLYNFDQARQYETGVICEGPSDVWSFGPMAVCCFGSSMSFEQQKKFIHAFAGRTAVLLLDPEAYEEKNAVKLIQTLRSEMGHRRFAVVHLPEGTDPGSLDREFLRSYVADESAKQRVRVSYRKRDSR